MHKLSKLVLIIITLISLFTCYSFATEENESLDSNNLVSEENTADAVSSENVSENIDQSFLTNSGVTSINQLSNYSESNLELNNILNIILIAIGVLIILFAIAILIRLKQ